MINFTVGPVQSEQYLRDVLSEQIPYFRTPEFSSVMLENEKLILKFAKADEASRAVFMTGSGTASMEAVVQNLLTPSDRALVVNGGSFGHRFVELLELHDIPFDEIKLETGKTLTEEDLEKYDPKNYTAFLVNAHETSTGVLYDLDMISEFCKKNNLLFIVDSISAFLADDIDMSKQKIDALIIGSQKALACAPGISIIAMSKRAVDLAYSNNPKCYYLNLKSALKNQERGQTPFTPAVGTLLQINARLKNIDKNGGVQAEINRTHKLAEYFRNTIKDLPLEIVSNKMSNAVTPLHPKNVSAYDIFTKLKDEYGIWVCPNGGDLKDKIFRVGHIGYLTKEDYDKLILALRDMNNKNLL